MAAGVRFAWPTLLLRGSLWDWWNEPSSPWPDGVDSPQAQATAHHAHPGSINLTTSKPDIDRIVQELMDGELSKAQRIKRLRDLATSGDDIPQDLMDQALRKLMERITE